MDRQQLVQAHDRSRGSEIGLSQRAFERVAERKEPTLDRAHAVSRGLSDEAQRLDLTRSERDIMDIEGC